MTWNWNWNWNWNWIQSIFRLIARPVGPAPWIDVSMSCDPRVAVGRPARPGPGTLRANQR